MKAGGAGDPYAWGWEIGYRTGLDDMLTDAIEKCSVDQYRVLRLLVAARLADLEKRLAAIS